MAAEARPASAARLSGTRLSGTRLARPASKPIKAIPRRKPIPGRLAFLSCRCAVIVGADNIRVGGHWTQPRAVLVGIRLRRQPGFDTQGSFMYFASRLAA